MPESAPSSAASSPPAIVIDGVSKAFESGGREVLALDDVKLEIGNREFVSLVGPSGCGKTSLLRILAGLESKTKGDIHWNVDTANRPLLSVVFQQHGVFPWMRVIDNAAFGLTVRGVPRKEANDKAIEILQRLGLADFTDMYPRQLSGGMNQRVNLARAFINDPAVLLMDEPLAALDEPTKMLVQEDLLRLWQDSRKTVLFITHSLDEAIVLSDVVAVMTRRPGRIKGIVKVDLDRPRNALEIRNDEKFLEIRRQIWDLFRSEVTTGER